MLWLHLLALLLLYLLHDVRATPMPHYGFPKSNDARITIKETKAFAPATELKVSDKIVNLKRTDPSSGSSKALLAGRTTSLNPVMLGGSYGMSVGLGDESFTLIFDTGSSDLWVAESGFQCDGFLGGRVPPSMCHFGPLFSGNFEGGEIPNQNFHLAYGGGEFVSGRLGYEDVIVAGVTVNHQEIAFVDEAFWDGDDLTSGIVGFAYSSLTSAYTGTDPANDDPATNNVHYTNFIGNAIKQGKIDPMFSHVLERGPNGGTGQLALGGLPPIDFDHNFTSVPLQIVEFDPSRHIAATNYTYYTIELHSVVLNGAVEPTKFPVVVDSGTTLAYLPSSLTRTINKAFDPPSKLIDGLWENDCSATPPSFSFCIGGKDFHINPAELLLPKSLDFDESSGNCVCGIQSVTEQPYILGNTFLKNVVAVYDIGSSEMRFAPHETY